MGASRVWLPIGVVVLLCFVGVAAWAGFVPIEVPFLANSETGGSQRQPDVAFDGTGRSLVVWDTNENGAEDIAGRLIAPDGSPVGLDLQINTYTSYQQIRPAVAGLSTGGFVVVWESYVLESEEDELYVQRLDSAGNLIGTEIRIDDSDFHLHADIAGVPGGGFVVVWDDGFDIFGRRFNSNGSPIGDDFFVNTELGTMYGPRVGASSGGFIVVWEDQSEIDGDGAGIFMRRFRNDGDPLGDDVQVNSTTEGDQYAPALAVQPGGAFAVVWESYGQSGLGDGAFGRVFNGSGVALGTDFRVDSGDSAYAGYVDAAPIEDGFAVVWNEPREGGGEVFRTLLRRLDDAGDGADIVEVDQGDDGDQVNGVVAGGGSDVMVAWEGFGPEERDIFGQGFGPLPTPTVPPGSCVGDCNGDGAVSIAELIRAVNISLGQAPIGNCSAADRNGDGSVSIAELIAAVNSSLEGCA